MLSPEYIAHEIGEFVARTKTWSEDRTKNGNTTALAALSKLYGGEVNSNTIPNQLPEYWVCLLYTS